MSIQGNHVRAISECYRLHRAPLMGIGKPMSHQQADAEVRRLAALSDSPVTGEQIENGIRLGRGQYLRSVRCGEAKPTRRPR